MTQPKAVIRGIATHFPDNVVSNAMLDAEHPEWQIEKVASRTGIYSRRWAAKGETGIDLAEQAVLKLLASGASLSTGGNAEAVDPQSVDALVLCTQTPDYLMPTNACLLQARVGLPTSVMAFDFNLGCSGFVHGLALVKGLIAIGQVRRAILVNVERLSRILADDDRGTRALFGDGATATLIEAGDDSTPGGHIESSIYGADGRGGAHLMMTGAGFDGRPLDPRSAGRRPEPTLFLDGAEIFAFTLQAVPQVLNALYKQAGINAAMVDRFIFHQANEYLLDHLRRKLKIAEERFIVDIAELGNTSSCTIPTALSRALASGRIGPGQRIVLVGFGVGLSWGAVLLDWR